MSEKWEIGIDMLQDRLEHVSDYADAEVEAADYVLANAIEAAPCPPGVRVVPGYQAFCVLCGAGPPPEAEYQSWMSVGGTQIELNSDSFQTLDDGRQVCNDADCRCWKWCECEDCGGEEKIIGTDQDTCQAAAGPGGV